MSKDVVNPEREEKAKDTNGENAAPEAVAEEESQEREAQGAARPDDDEAAATEAASDGEREALEHEVEELQRQLSEVNDKLLRQAADYQNYRRRSEREKSKMMELGQRQVMLEMLEVLDDFQRSLEAADQVDESAEEKVAAEYASFREGIEFVYQKFLTQLDKLGVEPIEAVGKPFDEQLHEAVMQQPAPEGTEEGTVLEEVQKGYMMGDRVLRHSKVVVAA